MHLEFCQSARLDSLLTGLMYGYLDVYLFVTISLCNLNHLVQFMWDPVLETNATGHL